MNKTVKLCASGFVVTILAAVLLLFFASFIPQAPINRHIQQCSAQLRDESTYSLIGDSLSNSLLDMNTDMLILIESLTMNRDKPESIFTNPRYDADENTIDYIGVLDQVANGQTPGEEIHYVRYWMGFRWLVRLLLTVFNYYELRRLSAIAFFGLFFLVCYSLSVQLSPRIALAFAFSILLIKPHVVAVCLQFSCCFLIAFAAMLLVPGLRRSGLPIEFLLMELGMITMYFDFYTTPLVTFALPMTYSVLLDLRDGHAVSLRRICRYFLVWLSAYVLMWLAKLALTTIFTNINGFYDAFFSFRGWMTTTDTIANDTEYSFMGAMLGIARGFYVYTKWAVLFILALAVFAAIYLRALRSGKADIGLLRKNVVLLSFAGLAVLWFVVSNRAAYYHSWFQYRTFVVIFWSVGAWLSSAVTDHSASAEGVLS